MKFRQILLFASGLVIPFILAFFLQDVIRRVVVTPLAYLWWLLQVIYSSVPQLFLWILLLVLLVLIIAPSLGNSYSAYRQVEEPIKPVLGPVESLAGWFSDSSKGNYYKWKIANRLGKLWREGAVNLGNRRRPVHLGSQELPGRLPSQAVEHYLKAGLDKSFVDYPLPRLPFMRRQATPFDLDVEAAVDFLESEIKDRWGSL